MRDPRATLSGRMARDAGHREVSFSLRALPPVLLSELAAETLRLHERYQEEVVEAFNLCPWAKSARLTGNTIPLVDDGRALLEQLRDAAQSPAEVLFLILPTYTGDRAAFSDLVASLIADDARSYRDSSPPFAMAAFHPEPLPVCASDLSAEALIPHLRRSPNPTVQLVRLDALERVRQGEPAGTSFIDPSQLDFSQLPAKLSAERPSLRHRISSANHATARGPRGPRLEAVLEDILEDRRRTHTRLGLPLCSWEAGSEAASQP